MNVKNRIVAVISSLFVLLTFASCSSESSDYYIDDNGTKYLVNRNTEGNIQINENGKLLVYSLNENDKCIKSDSGEYITEFVEFNGQVVSDGKVETKEMKFTLPKNFSEDRNNTGYFYNENCKGEIFINYFNEDINTGVQAIQDTCQNLLESFGSEVYSYNEYSLDVDGIECIAIEQLCTSSEYYQNVFTYLIPYDTGYYSFDCTVNTDYKNKVNYDKFIKSITLKETK